MTDKPDYIRITAGPPPEPPAQIRTIRSEIIHSMPAVELFGLDGRPFIHSDLISSLGGSPYTFVPRDEPTSHDLTLTDFTLDFTWRTKSLSSIIPSGTLYVALGIAGRSPGGSDVFYVAQVPEGTIWLRVPIPDTYDPADHGKIFFLAPDSNRAISYYGTAYGPPTILNFCVRGWLIAS